MLKQLLLIGAAAVSFPALAQEAPPTDEPGAPIKQNDNVAPEPINDPTGSTVPETSEVLPAAGDTMKQAPQKATTATPEQVAQIVGQEFPTYDADSSTELNEAEFAAWMKKLRTATDPTVDPESDTVKTWIGQAYVIADVDKSGGVSQSELTGFLTRGA